ncbi:hypothetical protein BJF92_15255 [Rhizobium rhizosphaerae]|uniref:Uncharacterized protein n=1 Tax=Xaviernesmea rhizosphaerae TaxID=1672749 RepID=A0A1Q9ALS6_9HYPH|nr:hypothetical protein [Xaviernesmea rhizosphaerae]OLP56257.1 hypothetical protein BJF92_15255 [Xaviernesmea rhizosphaerae]
MTAENGITSQHDNGDEIMALGRMVSFACQRSKVLELGMSTYFLEMALLSLVTDIEQRARVSPNVEPAGMVADISEFH